jgi:hypothetical protein
LGKAEPIYPDEFTSGAAELTERVCCGLEFDPKYGDVVVLRWQSLSGKQATLDGDGRSFEDIKTERLGAAARRSTCGS